MHGMDSFFNQGVHSYSYTDVLMYGVFITQGSEEEQDCLRGMLFPNCHIMLLHYSVCCDMISVFKRRHR